MLLVLFSALALSAGWQEAQLACKNIRATKILVWNKWKKTIKGQSAYWVNLQNGH